VAISNYGMYFGNGSIDTITKCTWPITYLTPQIENSAGIITDTLNWVAITGTFVANGTEKYMVLGNFKSNAATNTLQLNTPTLTTQSADIYVDDVSVIDIDLPAYAGPDIWAIPGNTIYLGRPQDVGIDEACMWYKLPNITTAIDTAAGITVTVASVTNTYMVKQDICGVIKYDTVVVYASGVGDVELQLLNNKLKLYPNPANEILNVELKILNEQEPISNLKFIIYNSLWQLIREEDLKNNSVNVKDLPNGVYVLTLSPVLSSPQGGDKRGAFNKRFVIAR
jgi:hypothetical protein